jgi:alkanesulfonate monooxygenase SsuD/methylene tetrahydromethanopterin reductase-like flavin-dependent oxidoreductase (luciferase family)
MNGLWTDAERAMIEHTLRYAIVGSADTVRTGMHAFLEQTSIDELLVTAHIFDQGARLRSFEIIAETMR